ncbi:MULTISPECIES: hypothetical protein [Bacillus cereus group]|uniref:hypothetical protein n=1 Tax=Bacillus cereus group TaxID=86661 RepID=UPI0022E80B15|nr:MULTISPECIES: hypothetical protein [unclassified Bacillus cereus group]MDA1849692.1 hypothetical protein [Bacillus cereus]MDA2662633.1 hypothetical protein [Bacillus cereus group sp. Bc032]MDA2673356.1 hypothetical protein [Bacillus cereus group sp. Bc031]MDA2678882.1 hypothetical protein [Bacillus cereus group sp. Bc029]MDA2684391.1 hypothetical protein [Bacillus cereus group sp. Bc030]
MKENYKSATHIGDMVVGIQMGTKVFQKKLRAIGNHAHELADELQRIDKEEERATLANYSTDELIEEIKSRAIKVSGSSAKAVAIDALKLANNLEVTITKKI